MEDKNLENGLNKNQVDELKDIMDQASKDVNDSGNMMSGAGDVISTFQGKLTGFFNRFAFHSASSNLGNLMLNNTNELVKQQLGTLLIEALLAFLRKQTMHMKDNNSFVRMLFHDRWGRVVTAILVSQAGAWGALYASQYASSRGNDRQAAILAYTASVLGYSSGTAAIKVLGIPDLIDNVCDWIGGIADEANINVEELAADLKKIK